MKTYPNNITFSVVIEKDKDGYVAECRELQGCYADGTTYEEVLENIKNVISLQLEDRVERGDFSLETFTENNSISLTTLSLPIPNHVS